jgi:hypothetical protein
MKIEILLTLSMILLISTSSFAEVSCKDSADVKDCLRRLITDLNEKDKLIKISSNKIEEQKKEIDDLKLKTASLAKGKVFRATLVSNFTCGAWTKLTGFASTLNTLNAGFSDNTFSAPRKGHYLVFVDGHSSTAGSGKERYATGAIVNGVLQGFGGGNSSEVDSPLSSYSQVLTLNEGDKVHIAMYCALPLHIYASQNTAAGHSLIWNMVFIGEQE